MSIPIPLLPGVSSEPTSIRELATAADDLLMLAEVIEAGGFTAASQRTGIAKSHLSRRIAALEKSLGVALINRDSRRFEVTETGAQLHEQAMQIREATRNAVTIAADSNAAPGGLLRVACPIALQAASLSAASIEFARRHPRVRLCLSTTRGVSDIEPDRYDLVIHPSNRRMPDSDLVAQRLSTHCFVVAAAPALLQAGSGAPARIDEPADLEGLPAIGWNSGEAIASWILEGPADERTTVRLRVCFSSDNLLTIREAAVAGLGVARLPLSLCHEDLVAGRLERLVPAWQPPAMSFYALYQSRRRVSRAAQAFIEVMREALQAMPVGVETGELYSA